MDDGPARYLETALQVAFAGYAKGLENCDDEFQEFAAEVDGAVSAAERAETPDARAEVTDEIAEIFRRYLPDGTTGRDADDAVDNVDHSHTDETPPEGNPIDPADADRDTELEPTGGDDAETPDETPDDAGEELDDLDDLDADDFAGDDDPAGDADAPGDAADETDVDGAAVDDGGAGDGTADDGTGPLCPDCGHTVEVIGGADE
jgi:hypothetical protein